MTSGSSLLARCTRNECANEASDGYKTCQRCRDTRNAWKQKNPDKVKSIRKKGKYWYNHDAHVVKTYGLVPGQYAQMMIEQGGVCAVCGEECSTGRRLAVDHDHETGKVRALLCLHCNRAVGHLKDDPVRALKLADYLSGFQGVG